MTGPGPTVGGVLPAAVSSERAPPLPPAGPQRPGLRRVIGPRDAGNDPFRPLQPSQPASALPPAHPAAGPHPTPPPHTTQHRPSASPGDAARAALPAIGQTRHSAISAYRAVRVLIGQRRRWAGRAPGRAGRGGIAPWHPASWSSPGRSPWTVPARWGERRAQGAWWLLGYCGSTGSGRAAAAREGCWRGDGQEPPPSEEAPWRPPFTRGETEARTGRFGGW